MAEGVYISCCVQDNLEGREEIIAYYGDDVIVVLKEQPDPAIFFRDKKTDRNLKTFKEKDAVTFIKYNSDCYFIWDRQALLDRFGRFS
jgi:hypothetical protein